MQPESHKRALFLLDQDLVEGISVDERRWLDIHLEGCAECSRYAGLSGRSVRALDSFAFELDPVAALRVQEAVCNHATRLAAAESLSRSFWIGTAVAMLLTIIGSMAMWLPAAKLAARWNVPTPMWQVGFVLFWFLPSTVLGMLPLFQRKLMGGDSGEGGPTV